MLQPQPLLALNRHSARPWPGLQMDRYVIFVVGMTLDMAMLWCSSWPIMFTIAPVHSGYLLWLKCNHLIIWISLLIVLQIWGGRLGFIHQLEGLMYEGSRTFGSKNNETCERPLMVESQTWWLIHLCLKSGILHLLASVLIRSCDWSHDWEP